MKSPERFPFTNKFLKVGSIQGEVPIIFEIVAVGAIAILGGANVLAGWDTEKCDNEYKNHLPQLLLQQTQ